MAENTQDQIKDPKTARPEGAVADTGKTSSDTKPQDPKRAARPEGGQQTSGGGSSTPRKKRRPRPEGAGQGSPRGGQRPKRRPPRTEAGSRPPQRTSSAPASKPPAAPPPAEVELPDHLTVREMGDIVQRSPIDIIKVLMNYGIMAPITQTIDYDTAAIVAEELGVKVKPKEKAKPTDEEESLERAQPKTLRQRLLEATPEDRLALRPPVVTVLGHVDHGKTTLLDAIRDTNVVSGESGGITQHIGAYQVEYDGRKVTFLDTPGHEAFTAMRARGAQATDIAILVVAADDGVMPQTKEAIAHARAAGVPIVIALNKIDKANANPDRVKQELSDQGLVVEEWGGDVICVPVSAKLRQGINELLENVLLLADVESFKADPTGSAVGTVIESRLDRARGATATLLVQKGTLKVGDALILGSTSGRVRAMFDDKGQPVAEARPSMPVVVIGLADVPTAGDTFEVMESEREARELAADRSAEEAGRTEAAQRKFISLDDVFAQMKEGKVKELRLIIKADVDGSLEPVINSLTQLGSDDLRIKILHSGTGNITESDLMLATASNAIIIGFHVHLDPPAQKSDLAHQVDVRTYEVIYELIADVDKALKGLLEPVYEDRTLGQAEVRAVFRIPRKGNVAGCYVTEGTIPRNALVRVLRNGTSLFESRMSSLKRFQEDVTEVRSGFECGIGVENFDDFQEGDTIQAYQKVRV